MIKNIFERTKESVRDFTSDPINNLGFLIPILIGMITFISGVISYIRFIVAGGYVNQVNATKEFGVFSGYDEKFTSGTTGMITAGVVGKIILVLIGIEFVLMLINYFRTSGKAKRIVMIVDLVVMVIQIVLTTAVFWIAIGNLVVSEEAAYEALKPFDGISINPKAILITYAVITLASLICFLVLVLITKDSRWMIGYSAIALAVAYIGLPLVFLFLQNVIPLATGAIALAIIALVLFIIFKVVLAGGGESGNAGSTGSTHSSSVSSSSGGGWFSDDDTKKVNTGNLSEAGEKKRKNKDLVIEETCAYIPYFNRTLGFKLWKVHGMMHDYVASDNGLTTREVCSLELFEKGKFHIYESESGKEIKSNQIPWMKQN